MNPEEKELLDAVTADDLEAVGRLLKKNKWLLKRVRVRDKERNTLLHLAQSVEMVVVLWLNGANPKALNNRKQQPYESARERGQLDVASAISRFWP